MLFCRFFQLLIHDFLAGRFHGQQGDGFQVTQFEAFPLGRKMSQSHTNDPQETMFANLDGMIGKPDPIVGGLFGTMQLVITQTQEPIPTGGRVGDFALSSLLRKEESQHARCGLKRRATSEHQAAEVDGCGQAIMLPRYLLIGVQRRPRRNERDGRRGGSQGDGRLRRRWTQRGGNGGRRLRVAGVLRFFLSPPRRPAQLVCEVVRLRLSFAPVLSRSIGPVPSIVRGSFARH